MIRHEIEAARADAAGAVKALFELALEQPIGARHEFVAARCAGEPALAREVLSLLQADADAGDFLEQGALAHLAADPPDMRCGPYRLLSRLAEGGSSVVYLAVHERAPLGEHVAVKLIKPGTAAGHLLSRWRREQRILASLSHPHIARLLDGGETASGQPYFVLELVAGEHIDLYCERRHLGRDARLRLFATVCRTVHFAHQSLVVHRDIKPSNILVTTQGVPKLIDFGIAKLLDPELGATASESTFMGLRPMTPAYASPEQVMGRRLTTASDVYSLGVVLYRLLTGRPPYEVGSRAPRAVERIVCETEPPPPSARLAPRQRRARGLSRDLDTIVLMALHKDPARRYPSALELGRDLERLMEGFPVTARRDTVGYRAGKLVRRHLGAVIAAGLVMASLIAGGVGTLWQAHHAVAARHRAEAERARVEQVSAFLLDLFKVSSDRGAAELRGTALDLLARGKQALDEHHHEPLAQAALLNTLGIAYHRLGAYRQAVELIDQGLRLRREANGEDDPEVAESMFHLALAHQELGDAPRARQYYQRSLAIRERTLGPDHALVAESLNGLATLETAFDLSVAEGDLHRALAIRRRAFGSEHPLVAATLGDLAWWTYARGRYDEAESMQRQVLAMRRRLLGDHHLEVAQSLNDLGIILSAGGRYDEAESALGDALAMADKLLGAEHPTTIDMRATMATVWRERGRLPEAEVLLRRSLAERERVRGEHHPAMDNALSHLATVLYLEGAYPEAVRHGERALALRRALHGDRHRSVAESLFLLGRLELARGDEASAAALLQQAHDIWRQAVPQGHPRQAEVTVALARCLRLQGEHAAAEGLLSEALDEQRAMLRAGHPALADTLVELALLFESSDAERAEAMAREALEVRDAALGPQHWATAQARSLVGALAASRGAAGAAALVSEGYAGLREALGPSHPETLAAKGRRSGSRGR